VKKCKVSHYVKFD